MTRVVVDTNVFVSSFFGGNPRKVIDLWKSGDITLCLSAPIVDEYINVLRRLGLQNEGELDELLGLFAHGVNVVFTTKTPQLHVVEEDPDDDKFIACAIAGGARIIVSGDNDLLSVSGFSDINVVTPREFIDRYLA